MGKPEQFQSLMARIYPPDHSYSNTNRIQAFLSTKKDIYVCGYINWHLGV